jgi:hypothetical protein
VTWWATLIAVACAWTGPAEAARHDRQARRIERPGDRPRLIDGLSVGRMPPPAALAGLDPSTRRDFEARVALRATYRPTRRPRRRGELGVVDDKKVDIEGYLVACAGRPDVAATAARYAATAVLAYEWEGFSEGPLAEAAHAEQYLKRYPRSVLRGGLELFLLVRYRAAFEAASYQGNREDQLTAAEGYRAVWARLSTLTDAVIKAVARDIDEAQRVYMGADEHPRTFNR